MEERLQKIISRAGFGSRRACEEIIQQGRVRVNGQVAEIGQKADPARDQIQVDGQIISAAEETIYIAMYKPRGVLSTVAAPDPRPTVRDLVDLPGQFYPVGRLDVDSEGLILLTNDGELANRLTHPRYGHEKEYRVLVARRPDEKQLETWRRGVVLEDGYRTQPAEVWTETPAGKGIWLRVVLREGRKRQIRETGSLLGLPVVRIVRVRIGSLLLGSLKPREWRPLSAQEVAELKGQKQAPVQPVRSARPARSERPVRPGRPEGKPGVTRGGDRPARSGDRPARSGDRPARSGDRPAHSGDRPARSGDRPARSGDRPNPRQDRPDRGEERSTRRTERPVWSDDYAEKPSRRGKPGPSASRPPKEDKFPVEEEFNVEESHPSSKFRSEWGGFFSEAEAEEDVSTQSKRKPERQPERQPVARPSEPRPGREDAGRPARTPRGRKSDSPSAGSDRDRSQTGSRPGPRQGSRSGSRPEPDSRPGSRPGSRQGSRPGSRPGSSQGSRPGSRPGSSQGSRPGQPGRSGRKGPSTRKPGGGRGRGEER